MEEGQIFLVFINKHQTVAPSLGDLAFFCKGPSIRFIFPQQQRPIRLNNWCETEADVVFSLLVIHLLHVLLSRYTVYNFENRIFSVERRKVFLRPELRNVFTLDNLSAVFYLNVDFSLKEKLLLSKLFKIAHGNSHNV